jgi:hypothetical protein
MQEKDNQSKKLDKLERGARIAVIEDLFYDFNQNRSRVYWTNFTRGIFFGVGSVVGATIVIGIIVSILNFFTDIPGGIGDVVKTIVDRVNSR